MSLKKNESQKGNTFKLTNIQKITRLPEITGADTMSAMGAVMGNRHPFRAKALTAQLLSWLLIAQPCVVPPYAPRNWPPLKGAALPKFMPLHKLHLITAMALHLITGWGVQRPTSLAHLGSQVPSWVGCSLCCNYIAAQLLPHLLLAWLPHKHCSWERSPANFLHANLHLRVDFLETQRQ